MIFVPQLDGMHWLMSFIDSIGALMVGSDMKEILSSAFADSEKPLMGKEFPMNLRVFRFIVAEFLRGHVEEMGSSDEIKCWISHLCETSVLAEPLFLMLLYARAEREGEFGLHLHVCE